MDAPKMLARCRMVRNSSEVQDECQGIVNGVLLGRGEAAGVIAESLDIHHAKLFDQDPCHLVSEFDLGPEGRRCRPGGGWRNDGS